jgi:hypothetical protein
MTRWLIFGLSLLLAACTSPPLRQSLRGEPAAALDGCHELAQALRAAVAKAGVGDVQAVAIDGFDWLRADRFTAALGGQAASVEQTAAWLVRLRALDTQARRIEIANLPDAWVTDAWVTDAWVTDAWVTDALMTDAALTGSNTTATGTADRVPASEASAARHALQTRIDACGRASIATIAREPALLERLRRSAQVPDDYVDWQRAVGVYPLSALAFEAGVRREEAAMAAAHARHADSVARDASLMLISQPSNDAIADANIRLAQVSRDALGVPQPDERQAAALLARHAPVIALAGRSDDDRIGSLRLDAQGRSVVDIGQPAVYGRIAFMPWQGEIRVQLVYTAWFARRPPEHSADLLAGHLDGIVLRLTLNADERIDMIDSIHPCGCWHQFIPVGDWQVQTAPAPREEWAFVARRLTSVPPGHRVRIRLSAGAHMLEGIDSVASLASNGADSTPEHYTLLSDDLLRSLALPSGGRRSLYDPRGFIPGTERAEAWLFWPMGISEAGSMRQWGHHATAFVGRRHFDDADLLERRFVRPEK